MSPTTDAIGKPLDRLDGPLKVRGAATYAFEWKVDEPAYAYPLLSEIARGRITAIDSSAATAVPGVLDVLTHENAPHLAAPDPEISTLLSPEVSWRGQFIGAVLAETSEVARDAAGLVRVDYEEQPFDAEFDPANHEVVKPQGAAFFGSAPMDLQNGEPADTEVGDVDAALAAAAVTVDQTYTTPIHTHNPLEPHAAIATWTDDGLTVYCSSQGVHAQKGQLAATFGLEPERVRAISPHVGGGFGSKVFPCAYLTLAAMAAQLVPGRPVKFTLTRQQMFSQVGYRPPTSQRLRLGSDADGRLTALSHEVIQGTAKAKGYAEQVGVCSRTLYATPNLRTTHRIDAVDLQVPTIMRGPGEMTGMWALESAIDELAIACGVDPVELRIFNEPQMHPESGLPFSTRRYVECLREGAERFGWETRDPAPRLRRQGDWLVGEGVAGSMYPSPRLPGNSAAIRVSPEGRYAVMIGAADIGTGTWTALTQIAADALGVGVDDIDLQIGDTDLPLASSAGFSSGINCWGTSIYAAADKLRSTLESEHGGEVPADGLEVATDIPDNPDMALFEMYSFGAQFAEVHVHADTRELRVPRLIGVFDVGRIINPKTARSQLIGGMTQGISAALHEHSVVDPRFGHIINHDFAGYHIAANADAKSIEAHWLDGEDLHVNPMGSKGVGEVCIVGTAAAVANAVNDATGIRVRDLPITLDKLL
jgi:xanthine dehydrogenase YagR molybdenum-binding subunit